MEDDLVGRLRSAAPGALADLPVRFAYLFGSRADGTARPDSDVDVAVMVDDVESWAAEMDREILAAIAAGRR